MTERAPSNREPSSDDTREREPLRDQADFPAEEGVRGDLAGTSASVAGVAPGGDVVQETAERTEEVDPHAPGEQATGSSGGYGVGSAQGSGGTGEGIHQAGEDPETEWLRDAPGGGGR